MESRENRLIKPLLEFYDKGSNLKQFVDVVVFKNKNLPLRLLNWFVTNYSKKKHIFYDIKRPTGRIENFQVFKSYRAQLKGNKKREFDPFCRGSTITLEYEADGENKITFQTAICQLKFFKWAIENLILQYVESNFEDISNDMRENNNKTLEQVIENCLSGENGNDNENGNIREKRKKRSELSHSIFKGLHVVSLIASV
jgi:hypothetical protein